MRERLGCRFSTEMMVTISADDDVQSTGASGVHSRDGTGQLTSTSRAPDDTRKRCGKDHNRMLLPGSLTEDGGFGQRKVSRVMELTTQQQINIQRMQYENNGALIWRPSNLHGVLRGVEYFLA